jgi:hypothetical protein
VTYELLARERADRLDEVEAVAAELRPRGVSQ